MMELLFLYDLGLYYIIFYILWERIINNYILYVLDYHYKYIIIILSRKIEKGTRYGCGTSYRYYCFANDNFHAKQNKVE